jgi:hypothetical protein
VLELEDQSGWPLQLGNRSLGDHPQAKQVYDLDSVTLLYTIKCLNEGKDLVG